MLDFVLMPLGPTYEQIVGQTVFSSLHRANALGEGKLRIQTIILLSEENASLWKGHMANKNLFYIDKPCQICIGQ